jgi:hypothetical protein
MPSGPSSTPHYANKKMDQGIRLNKIFKRISGLKGEKIRRRWGKLLYNLYTSPNIVKILETRAHLGSY